MSVFCNMLPIFLFVINLVLLFSPTVQCQHINVVCVILRGRDKYCSVYGKLSLILYFYCVREINNTDSIRYNLILKLIYFCMGPSTITSLGEQYNNYFPAMSCRFGIDAFHLVLCLNIIMPHFSAPPIDLSLKFLHLFSYARDIQCWYLKVEFCAL